MPNMFASARLGQTRFVCQDCLRKLQLPGANVQYRRASKAATSRPLRLGIIGSGPAGFYAAARVLKKLKDARVDMYEKLPVPFGLVRYGVAPDHPEVKNCQDTFEKVASSDHFQFIGNATIGQDITLRQMKQHYDALLFAYGASKDRLLGITGESELKGVHSAREFVGWYNGLPEFADLAPNLDAEHAVVIGNGNVALDVARILLSNVDSLRSTDIADVAIDALSKSRIRRVTIAGRRGPMQAAFTIKELRELVNLPETAFRADNVDLIPSADWVAKLPRLEQRKYRYAKLLTEGSREGKRSCHLKSMVSPDAFLSEKDDGVFSHLCFKQNVFKDVTQRFEHRAQVQPTDHTKTIEAGLAFRSIGYKATPLAGLKHDLGVDFNEATGIIPNDGFGRALALPTEGGTGGKEGGRSVVAGCYCTGWVKNGPTGVIATTMEDAFASADSIISDWNIGAAPLARSSSFAEGWDSLQHETKAQDTISWNDWRAIDRFEKQTGREKGGKPRSKLRDVAEMVTAAKTARVS